MFVSKLLIVSLLSQGVFSQHTSTENCKVLPFAKDAPPCPSDTTEMYHDKMGAYAQRFCCPTGSKAEKDQFDSAYVCRITNCQPASSSASNLCSTLVPRFVGEKQLTFEETLRSTCTRADGETGATLQCCINNSFSSLLLALSGAERNEFPHMAYFNNACGGTIYNKRYILTAAHCLVGHEDAGYKVKDPKGILVSLGTNIVGGGSESTTLGNTYQVEQLIPHEGYSLLAGHPELSDPHKRTFNDIGVVRLSRDIEFGPGVKSLEMAPKGFTPLNYADHAVIAGWGTQANLQMSLNLHNANLRLRSDESCFNNRTVKWPRFQELKEQLLCVGGIMEGVASGNARQGDSGGPAICRGQDGRIVHCGLTSFGPDDAACAADSNERNCRPNVFANVGYFSDWIRKQAGEQDESTFYKPYLYGEMVAPKKYEHQVHITSSSGNPCGGTLISPDTVLTAAQCVADPDTGRLFSGLKVTTGVRDLTSQGRAKTFGVKRTAVLEGFKRVGNKIDPETNGQMVGFKNVSISDSFHTNDLALVRLDGKVDISESSLPELPSSGGSVQPTMATEVSFPRNTSRSGQLLQREFQLLGQSECQTRMEQMERAPGLKVKIDKNILCGVETYSGGSLCDRELGGGLFCKGEGKKDDVLCGVQVFRLCDYSIPNGFLNMALYKGWVDETMRQL